jgi:hypothetical protein
VTTKIVNSNGATSTMTGGSCGAAGGTTGTGTTDANGQCTIVINGPTTGLVKAFAYVTVHFAGGLTIDRDADSTTPTSHGPGGTDEASKTWVDANISITPAFGTNATGVDHTLTAHVQVDTGNGVGFGNPPDGTVTVNFTLSNDATATATFDGPSSCTIVGGICTVNIKSPTPGVTTVNATTSLSVGGVPLTRGTGPSDVHGPGGSGPASKLWIHTDVHDSSHNVITTIAAPATVHDNFQAAPGVVGNVTFTLYDTVDCSGSPDAANPPQTVPLTLASGGVVESTPITLSPTSTQSYSFLAHYTADPSSPYPSKDAGCEPFTVTAQQAPTCPAGLFAKSFNSATGDVTIKYDQFPAPNDNSYGTNAVGWGTKGHTFNDLVGSDHAGFEVLNPSNVDVLDFNIDYISTKTGTPSGYASLGPFGGDGKINVGSLTSTDLTYDTSLARNLNNLGYFTGGVQTVGTSVANLLVNSPPTLDPSGATSNAYVLTPAAAAVFTGSNTDSSDSPGWNFHDTYFVTLKASKLISIGAVTQLGPGSYQLNPGWSFAPNADELHNSPAKPCPCTASQTQGLNPTYTTSVVNFNGTPAYKLVFNQGLGVNDNMYSSSSPTTFWNGQQHKFSDLTGSDKAEFVVPNPAGGNLFDFFVDYISQTSTTSQGGHPVVSGYASLGPYGGDGSWGTQTAAKTALLGWTTTFDDDLNATGYCSGGTCPGGALFSNAPAPVSTTDETQGAAAPFTAWNYVDGYTVYLDKATVDAAYASVPGGFDPSGSTNANWSVPFQHNSPAKQSQCPNQGPPPPPPSTKATVAAAVGVASGLKATTPSFTLKAGTTYLVLATLHSAAGDTLSVSSTGLGSPTFNPVASQSYNGENYQAAWWLNGGATDQTGTVTVSWLQQAKEANVTVVQLSGNNTANPIANAKTASGNNTNPYTANLSPAPNSTSSEVVLLSGQEDLGGTAPVGTPPIASLTYDHTGGATHAVYATDTATASESFAGGNHHWGTIAIEINSATGPAVTVTTPASASGGVGTTVTLSGTGFTPSSPLTVTFGGAAVTLSGTTSTNAGGSFSGATFTVPFSANGVVPIFVSAGAKHGNASFTVTGSFTGIRFDFSGFTGAGGAAKWNGCTASGTTVSCSGSGIGPGKVNGTISLYSGSYPGSLATNASGAAITMVPTATPAGGSATTATIANGASTSGSLQITHAGAQTWTYSFTLNGVTYSVNVALS